MRKLSVVVVMMMMVTALLTSACGIALQDQPATDSRSSRVAHCEGGHHGQAGTNFADCDPAPVHIHLEEIQAPD
jgi:hypothetical protein